MASLQSARQSLSDLVLRASFVPRCITPTSLSLIIWCTREFTSSILQPALTHTALSVLVLSKCLYRFRALESPTNEILGFGVFLMRSFVFGSVAGGRVGVAGGRVELACCFSCANSSRSVFAASSQMVI